MRVAKSTKSSFRVHANGLSTRRSGSEIAAKMSNNRRNTLGDIEIIGSFFIIVVVYYLLRLIMSKSLKSKASKVMKTRVSAV